ncbi:uncharacterized protein LOC126833830 [Adelges cooleyi]|uniref:uncharacterized protein LOC126833830 n=1 Tax=Adelges cooleyi TaxID=133065 RepID=UPI0021808017|nr:uncharacterized protein LOC126833830 [Adelges cooleyi]
MFAKTSYYALYAMIMVLARCARCQQTNVVAVGSSTAGDYQASGEQLFEDLFDDDDDEDGDFDDDDDDGIEEDYDDAEEPEDNDEPSEVIVKAVQWLTASNGGTVDQVMPFYEELFKLQKDVAGDLGRNALDFSALYSAWAEFAKAPRDTDQQLLMLAYYQRLFAGYAADRERLRADLDRLGDMETVLLPSTVYPDAADGITGERMKLAFAMAAEQDQLMAAAVESQSSSPDLTRPEVAPQDDEIQYNKIEERRDGGQGERSLFPDTS